MVALEARAKQFLFELAYYSERDVSSDRLLIICDGQAWHDFAKLLVAASAITRCEIIATSVVYDLPGLLANHALITVTSASFSLLSIGADVNIWFINKPLLLAAMIEKKSVVVAGYRGPGESREADHESFLVNQQDGFSSQYPHAWLQMLDLVPTCNTILQTNFVRKMGGFTKAATFQRMWWWEFCLRVTRENAILSVPLQPVPCLGWHRYPFSLQLADPVDVNLRILMKTEANGSRVTPIRADECTQTQSVFSPLQAAVTSSSWRLLPVPLQQRFARAIDAKGRALKIAVLGGVNEPAHNQLCFFNYFALLNDANTLTWRSLLDTIATADDIADYDLVIFSRTRSANSTALMDYCVAHQIPTLYMLDDNWFWLGHEWEEYAPIFSPGAPDYEHFLYCMTRASLTLTYNAVLAEDLHPHAKRLAVIPTNVDLRVFPRNAANHRSARRTTIGYVGSLRKNTLAFEALQHIVNTREDVDLFVMSNTLPDEFTHLPATRIRFEPYQFNYAAYAATVCRAAPDVLVAPVGNTRFEASKCPNKFLEITAAGAVGVYSLVEPYLTHVIDGQTGVLVEDTLSAWQSAINKLIDDSGTKRKIAATAYAHVSSTFDTREVLPKFIKVLLDTIEGDGASVRGAHE